MSINVETICICNSGTDFLVLGVFLVSNSTGILLDIGRTKSI
jgi:hypothetical protein